MPAGPDVQHMLDPSSMSVSCHLMCFCLTRQINVILMVLARLFFCFLMLVNVSRHLLDILKHLRNDPGRFACGRNAGKPYSENTARFAAFGSFPVGAQCVAQVLLVKGAGARTLAQRNIGILAKEYVVWCGLRSCQLEKIQELGLLIGVWIQESGSRRGAEDAA